MLAVIGNLDKRQKGKLYHVPPRPPIRDWGLMFAKLNLILSLQLGSGICKRPQANKIVAQKLGKKTDLCHMTRSREHFSVDYTHIKERVFCNSEWILSHTLMMFYEVYSPCVNTTSTGLYPLIDAAMLLAGLSWGSTGPVYSPGRLESLLELLNNSSTLIDLQELYLFLYCPSHVYVGHVSA